MTASRPGDSDSLARDADRAIPEAREQASQPQQSLAKIGRDPSPEDDQPNNRPDIAGDNPKHNMATADTAASIGCADGDITDSPRDVLSSESPLPEQPDDSGISPTTNIGPSPAPGKSPKKHGGSPRKIGGRRHRASPGHQLSTEPQERRFTPRAELLCRQQRGSRRWELVVVVPPERPVAEAHQDGRLLNLVGEECAPSHFRGAVTITYQDGERQELPLYVDKPLIFKMSLHWSGAGRKLRGITKGHYIVIAHKHEQLRDDNPPVAPDGCKDEDFTAHYRFHDGDHSKSGPGGFGEDRLMLLDIEFILDGTTVYDDSDHGDLYVGRPPELTCSHDIMWVRIGEEKHEGWKGRSFKPGERSIRELLSGREGRFFVRAYDEEIHLQDSRDFRYHSDLRGILVNGEPYSADRMLIPPPSGHSATTIEFVKSDGQLLRPIASTEEGPLLIEAGGVVRVPARERADRVVCRLPAEGGEVETVINLPRIWWKLEGSDPGPAEWGDRPVRFTREGFLDRADTGDVIRLKMPRHVRSVAVGFEESDRQHFRPPKGGDDTLVPLSAFAEYSQIEKPLGEDAVLAAQWADKTLTLIRVIADPVSKQVAETARPAVVECHETVDGGVAEMLDVDGPPTGVVPGKPSGRRYGHAPGDRYRRGSEPDPEVVATRTFRQYELMTIHRPDLNEREYRERVTELTDFLGSHGAVVRETDPWGKRRLAYPVDHASEGYYAVVRFNAEPLVVDTLRRVLCLAEEVLRHKIVRRES